MKSIKIVAESSIPYLRGVIERLGEVTYLPSARFAPDAIRDADWLIIRSITRCDEALLRGSRVRLITSATIGFDHIDTGYCARMGITWYNAPGCNAEAVAQYFATAMALLSEERGYDLHGKVLGIVGVGHVGKLIKRNAEALGLKVLLNDPPRAEKEGEQGFVSLREIAQASDIITLHVPLEMNGKYPTYHLVDTAFVESLQKSPIIVNACRGSVTDTQALIRGLADGHIDSVVLDCWENEPHISRELLDKAWLATPHIAGFSAQGKANGARIAVQKGMAFFGLEEDVDALLTPPPLEDPLLRLTPNEAPLSQALLKAFNIREIDKTLRAQTDSFERLRKEYHYPYEPSQYTLMADEVGAAAFSAEALGFRVRKK